MFNEFKQSNKYQRDVLIHSYERAIIVNIDAHKYDARVCDIQCTWDTCLLVI